MIKLGRVAPKKIVVRKWTSGEIYQEGTHVHYPDSDSVWRCVKEHVADNPPDKQSEHWEFVHSVGKAMRRAVLFLMRTKGD